jgi:uncharacterized protein
MKKIELPLQFMNEGKKLFGVLHLPKPSGKFPCVVMFHGFTGTKAEAHFLFTKTARKLAENGIAAFRFDFMGSGDSEGRFEDMSVGTEISDARAAIGFIRKHRNINKEKTGILGLSMGGFVAAYTCGTVPGIKSTVLWSAVAAYRRTFEKLLGKEFTAKDLPKSRDFGGCVVTRKFYAAAMDYDGLNLESVNKYKGPLLIVHSDNDEAVVPESAAIYYQTSNSRVKQLKMIKGGGHTFGTAKIEPKVIALTVDWFKRTLK